jgi:hypothetical protein
VEAILLETGGKGTEFPGQASKSAASP